jgi:hypothetical protein
LHTRSARSRTTELPLAFLCGMAHHPILLRAASKQTNKRRRLEATLLIYATATLVWFLVFVAIPSSVAGRWHAVRHKEDRRENALVFCGWLLGRVHVRCISLSTWGASRHVCYCGCGMRLSTFCGSLHFSECGQAERLWKIKKIQNSGMGIRGGDVGACSEAPLPPPYPRALSF